MPLPDRPHRLSSLTWLLLALAGAASAVSSPRPGLALHYEGEARALDDGSLLYRESHWLFELGGTPQRLVLYLCPDGRPFARKRLRLGVDPERPEFDLVDGRDGYRERVRLRDGAVHVLIQEPEAEAPRQQRLALADGSVIDAGFDARVRRQWERLAAGHAQTLSFLVPSRGRYLDFRLAGARELEFEGEPALRLRMSPPILYRPFVPVFELTYGRQHRWLRRFEGLGTIRGDDGRPLPVRIDFPPRSALREVPLSEALAALERPLAMRCPD
ncbi:hypothetical protein [Arenimonas fontis]|uniref:DUF3108 domain-containing protein n=1 Tax=Arenimonas fontis TaxID=2608255 RepID=A0A5B2ZFY9_9GAMM|nr:hypothetical protein [Arenimonas fontis]KAA2286170.1 hypothetical protein F0415_01315 [Arenimonas fontis]